MPLSLPNLDDLRWEDLVAEGRSLVPAFAPEWTDHNPSDPGITLIELFAYASERLMYQTNRITTKHTLEFLKLINGREAEEAAEKELTEEKLSAEKVAELKRGTVIALREPRRAVTLADFERLARTIDGVARAICIPARNLQSEDPAAQSERAPGHVSVIVIPKKGLHPSSELLLRVKQKALEPARLLTTRIHVVGPRYLKFGIRVTVVLQRGTAAEAVRDTVVNRVKEFLDPLTGWIDQKGWPLGRSVYVSELYQLLGDIEGIESARPSRDSSGAAIEEFVLAPPEPGRMKRNARGELEAVELRAYELPSVTVRAADISIALKP